MNELLAQYWPVIIAALIIGVAVAWFVFVANRKAKVDLDKSDVLDAGKGPAARNQALIDAPASAVADTQKAAQAEAIAEVAPGPVSAAANMDETAHADAVADAEAGAPGSAREALQEMKAATPSAAGGASDDLTRIKGVGPKLKDLLNTLGVTRFDQIAAWDDAEIARIDAQLGRFEGRITRDNWVEQARLLASGDTAAYEGQFGKL